MRVGSRDRFGLVVGAEVVLGAMLAVVGIGRKNFWLDEGYSFVAVHRGFSDLVRLLVHDENNMALYYLVLHAWLHVGRSEAVLRLPSAAAAVAAVPVVASLARRLFSMRVGVVAGLATAINLMVVSYAQEARAYSLALLLAALSGLLFVSYVHRPRARTLLAWVLVSALGCYAQYFVALVIVAQVASLLVLPRTHAARRPLIVAAFGCALLAAPLVVFAVERGDSQLSTAAGFSPRLPAVLLYRFAGSIPLAVVAIALLTHVAVTGSRAVGADERRWELAFCWTWLLLPPALTLVGSIAHPLWRDRYLIVCLPAFLVLVAYGIEQLPRPQLTAAGAVLLVALSALALTGYYGQRIKNAADWRAATAFLLPRTGPQAPVFFVPAGGYAPYDYYSWQARRGDPEAVGVKRHPLSGRIHPATVPPSALAMQLAGAAHVWAVLLAPNKKVAPRWFARETEWLKRLLGPRFRPGSIRSFGALLHVQRYDSG